MQDKEECQALQRAVGNDEDRIEKCLEAKGWLTIKKEVSTVSLDDSVGSSTQY
jgi:primosomal protein N''